MPDRVTFKAHEPHSAYRALAHRADVASVEGDEDLCIELIERLYRLLDDRLVRADGIDRRTGQEANSVARAQTRGLRETEPMSGTVVRL